MSNSLFKILVIISASFYHVNKCTTQTQGANNRGEDKEGIWELVSTIYSILCKPKTALKIKSTNLKAVPVRQKLSPGSDLSYS